MTLRRATIAERRGAMLASVLVCLTLAMVLFGIWLKGVVRTRQQLQVQQTALQAEYLAAAGVNRASARLAVQPGYTGELWTVSAEQLAARSGAVIKIEVRSDTDAATKIVRAVAIIPPDGPPQAQRTKELRLSTAQPEKPEQPEKPAQPANTSQPGAAP